MCRTHACTAPQQQPLGSVIHLGETGTNIASRSGMTGITNRPEAVENENQERVERRKDELPDITQVNRPRKDHPIDKDRERDLVSRDRVSETGVGLGPDHKGH